MERNLIEQAKVERLKWLSVSNRMVRINEKNDYNVSHIVHVETDMDHPDGIILKVTDVNNNTRSFLLDEQEFDEYVESMFHPQTDV